MIFVCGGTSLFRIFAEPFRFCGGFLPRLAFGFQLGLQLLSLSLKLSGCSNFAFFDLFNQSSWSLWIRNEL